MTPTLKQTRKQNFTLLAILCQQEWKLRLERSKSGSQATTVLARVIDADRKVVGWGRNQAHLEI